jgi:GNAT superfamily N-acetyltransferase
MARRLTDLSLTTLDDLPAACRSCVFWEVADGLRGPTPDGAAAKEAWLQATQLEWGAPGKVVYLDDVPVGYALFAPGRHLSGHVRRFRGLGHGVSDDALLLATLWIAADARGSGLAKVLLHAVLRETLRRGGRALEAYGARGVGTTGSCVLDEDFLLANGFTVLQEHDAYPLLRLDVRQTVSWQESVSQALEGVRAALRRRERAPAPVARPTPSG